MLHIADQFSCRHILQVLYLRDSGWGSIKIGDIEIQLHKSVIKHFRPTDAVSALDSNLTIETIDEILHNHDEYLSTIKHRISHRHLSPSIIFLDPDTGLEPLSSRPTLEHVRANDLRSIWDQCKKDDVLVLYTSTHIVIEIGASKKSGNFWRYYTFIQKWRMRLTSRAQKMWPSVSRKKLMRYNLPMPLTANDLLDAARQLPPEDQQWLLRELLHEEEATWQKEVGEPEPGYDQWFRTKVEESLVDDSPGISHDQVVKEMAEFLSTARSGRKLKASA